MMRAVVGTGALAAAVISIITLASTVGSWFHSTPEQIEQPQVETHKHEGRISLLEIRRVAQLTFEEWWKRDVKTPLDPGLEAQAHKPGKLILFDVETRGFVDGTVLPLRIVVHDVTNARSRTIRADPLTVSAGRGCGCSDWVPIPNDGSRYYIEVAVYPPGPLRGEALKRASSAYFRGSA